MVRGTIRVNKPSALPVASVSTVTDTLVGFALSVVSHRRLRGVDGTGGPLVISALFVGEEVDTKGTHLGGPIDTDIVGCGGELEAVEFVATGPFSDGFTRAIHVIERTNTDLAIDSLLEFGVGQVGWSREGEGSGAQRQGEEGCICGILHCDGVDIM